MNALRKKDNHFFELAEYAYDKDGYEYKWDELILCPLEGEEVNYRMSQEKIEELRERYAGMAMQALIPYYDGNPSPRTYPDDCAKSAVEYADALIEILKK